jgi:preprotein translocase subunit SecA
MPHLDATLLARAQDEHDRDVRAPHVTAKGLERAKSQAPLMYSAPELGSDSPAIHTEAAAQGGSSATARRQQNRSSNPNRGSRGNKSRRKR